MCFIDSSLPRPTSSLVPVPMHCRKGLRKAQQNAVLEYILAALEQSIDKIVML